jgi:pimeloyl-ACP methyl ester carboxylesterase
MPLWISVLLVTLGVGQLFSGVMGWRTVSLVGSLRWLGWGVGGGLLGWGGWGVIAYHGSVVWPWLWLLLALPLTWLTLFSLGSLITPPPHPDTFFQADHPQHGGCQRLDILDGATIIPALLIRPLPEKHTPAAVCVIHGSGDSKTGFKWRLVRSLLAEGLTVLTIDLPGHGENRTQALAYPESLSALTAAFDFLRQHPALERVGMIGISLGGAMLLNAVAKGLFTPDTIAILETPTQVRFTPRLMRQELWRLLNAPVMSLFQEMSAWQLWQSWSQGAIRSKHSTDEIFDLLDPLASIAQLDPATPLLLVYSQHDPIAPLPQGQALQAAAPHAHLFSERKASHTTLTLIPTINQRVARWLRRQLI